jgi:hypothetical protein
MQLKPITAIAVLLLVVASLLIAGCTSSTTSSSGQNQATAYATAYVNDNIKNSLGVNDTIISTSVVENGTDGAILTVLTANTTKDMVSANGSTTKYVLNVKHFSSTDAATAFYNEQSFGYMQAASNGSYGGLGNMSQPFINPRGAYYTVTGHNATVNSPAVKITSLFPPTVDYLLQQNEFVTWGTITWSYNRAS